MSHIIQKVKQGSTLESNTTSRSSIQFGADAEVVLQSSEQKIQVAKLKEAIQVDGQQTENAYINAEMQWDVIVGSDKVIFWSPFVTSLFGKPKQKPGAATAGWYDFSEISNISGGKNGIIIVLSGVGLSGSKFSTLLLIEDSSSKLRKVAAALAEGLRGNLSDDKVSQLTAFRFEGTEELEISLIDTEENKQVSHGTEMP